MTRVQNGISCLRVESNNVVTFERIVGKLILTLLLACHILNC